jgi:hypothetical protein
VNACRPTNASAVRRDRPTFVTPHHGSIRRLKRAWSEADGRMSNDAAPPPLRRPRPDGGRRAPDDRTRSARFRSVERRLALVSRVLDELIELPGGRRVGIEPIVGLLPAVGDVAPAIVGFWLIAEAARFRLPGIVIARMAFNTLLDLAVGLVPVLGDLFDFAFKSNARNVELFRRYASDETADVREQQRFFAGLALVAVGAGWLLVSALGWLLSIRIPAP